MPVRAQETLVVGLNGPVHTVLTEDFTSEDAVHRESTGTSLDIYVSLVAIDL
jgi:hypothetical protein